MRSACRALSWKDARCVRGGRRLAGPALPRAAALAVCITIGAPWRESYSPLTKWQSMHSWRAFALHNVVPSVPLRAAYLVVLCQRHGRRTQRKQKET